MVYIQVDVRVKHSVVRPDERRLYLTNQLFLRHVKVLPRLFGVQYYHLDLWQ